MPIEIRCPGCQKLLRVPDTAAGKHARCPECQQVVNVPATGGGSESLFGDLPSASSSAVPAKPSPPPQQPAASPPASFTPSSPSDLFGDMGAPQGGGAKPPVDPSNPYAASGFYEQEMPAGPAGTLVHRRVSFDDVFNTTWTIFQNNMGPLAILGVMMFAIEAALQVLGQIASFASQASGEPAIIIGTALFINLLSFLVRPVIAAGATIACLKLLRQGHTEPGDFMQFGPFYGSTLLMNFLFALAGVGAYLVCLVPPIVLMAVTKEPGIGVAGFVVGILIFAVAIIYLGMALFLATAFIVDRRMGAIDSMRASWQYMQGNKGTMFLLALVTGLVGGLFVCITCSFGAILLGPFWTLMSCVAYMLATGQRQAISPAVYGPSGARF